MCNPHDTNSDKYDEKGAIDYDGFISGFENFPWFNR
jgi:hypothetical protein